MDEGLSRLSRQERSTLRRMEEDLAKHDPWFAASMSGPTARQYSWPRVFRLRALTYLILGIGLTVVAGLVHQTFCFLVALTCFAAAAARTIHDS